LAYQGSSWEWLKISKRNFEFTLRIFGTETWAFSRLILKAWSRAEHFFRSLGCSRKGEECKWWKQSVAFAQASNFGWLVSFFISKISWNWWPSSSWGRNNSIQSSKGARVLVLKTLVSSTTMLRTAWYRR